MFLPDFFSLVKFPVTRNNHMPCPMLKVCMVCLYVFLYTPHSYDVALTTTPDQVCIVRRRTDHQTGFA